MNNPNELQDMLATIQADIDKTIRMINQTIAQGYRELEDVVQQLKLARTPVVDAQLLVGVVPEGYRQTRHSEIQRVRPGRLGSVVKSPKKQTTCPFCHQVLRPGDLAAHIAQSHRQTIPPPTMPRSKESSTPTKRTAAQTSQPATAPRLGGNVPKSTTTCPLCAVTVRVDRLAAHLAKVHPNPAHSKQPTNQAEAAVQAKVSTKRPMTQKGSSVRTKSQGYISESEASREKSLEALDQSYRDRRDGGKELGQSRRDHGRFGSLSIYDDHSEDSFS